MYACMSVTRMSVTRMSMPCRVQVRSDVRQQGWASDPYRVEELVSVGKILLTKKRGDLLMQVAHTGQQCSSTQPANFEKEFKANRRTARRHRQPVPGTGGDSSCGRGCS